MSTENSLMPAHPGPMSESRNSSALESHTSSSASSVTGGRRDSNLERPKFAFRPKSESSIIPRDSTQIELTDEIYDEDDARSMSPRRNSRDVQKMGEEARRILEEQAKALHSSLLALVDRVESVKSEHDKLEGENRFLQSYIGELMSTSKITSTSGNKGKGKGSRSK